MNLVMTQWTYYGMIYKQAEAEVVPSSSLVEVKVEIWVSDQDR